MWQFNAAIEGWIKANSPKKDNTLSESEKDDLFAWIEAANTNRRTLKTMTYEWDGDRLLPVRRITFTTGA